MTKEQAIWEVEKENKREGNLNKIDGVECPICKNKGAIMYMFQDDDGDYDIRYKYCECKIMRDNKRRALRSGLGDYLNKRSKDYIVTEPWQKEAKDKMIEFCQKEIESDKWFIACGSSGTGKSLLVSIIANYLLNSFNKEIRYVIWTDFIGKLKRDMMDGNAGIVSEYFDEIKNVEVLFIDELLKIYNDTDLKYLIEIINYRYANNLKTLITSEKNIKDLLNIDEATFSRVVQKCDKFIIDIPKDRTKNYRLKNLNKGDEHKDEKA